jgi:hypothetical protein
LQFVGAKPTITFQRGTADSLSIAIWEDGQPAAVSDEQYAAPNFSDNTKGRMPAMRGRDAIARNLTIDGSEAMTLAS